MYGWPLVYGVGRMACPEVYGVPPMLSLGGVLEGDVAGALAVADLRPEGLQQPPGVDRPEDRVGPGVERGEPDACDPHGLERGALLVGQPGGVDQLEVVRRPLVGLRVLLVPDQPEAGALGDRERTSVSGCPPRTSSASATKRSARGGLVLAAVGGVGSSSSVADTPARVSGPPNGSGSSRPPGLLIELTIAGSCPPRPRRSLVTRGPGVRFSARVPAAWCRP